MTMAVIARHVVEHEQAGLGSPGIDELRWKKPVYPGDTLHVRGTIVEKTPSRSRPEMGSFRTRHDRHQPGRRAGDDLHLDRADPAPPARLDDLVAGGRVLPLLARPDAAVARREFGPAAGAG